jgi:hypothetical protein
MRANQNSEEQQTHYTRDMETPRQGRHADNYRHRHRKSRQVREILKM